jgi:hypothetical protein
MSSWVEIQPPPGIGCTRTAIERPSRSSLTASTGCSTCRSQCAMNSSRVPSNLSSW